MCAHEPACHAPGLYIVGVGAGLCREELGKKAGVASYDLPLPRLEHRAGSDEGCRPCDRLGSFGWGEIAAALHDEPGKGIQGRDAFGTIAHGLEEPLLEELHLVEEQVLLG